MGDTGKKLRFKVGDEVVASKGAFDGVRCITQVGGIENWDYLIGSLGYKDVELESANPEIEYRSTSIAGVGQDAPMVVNERGGKQSQTLYRFDLFEPQALFAMCKVLEEGARKYGEWNWFKIDTNDHLNHALIHIYAYLSGDTQDEHLEHAAVRAQFALTTYLKSKQQGSESNVSS